MKRTNLLVLALIWIFAACSKDDIASEEEIKNGKVHLDTKMGANFRQITVAALQPDGKLIVNGYLKGTNYQYYYRVLPDGSIDPSFDIDKDKGWMINDYWKKSSIVIQPDGKILISGEFTVNNNVYHLLRLNADGSLDRSFNSPTIKDVTDRGTHIGKLHVQKDGKIVFSGTGRVNGKWARLLTRLNYDGSYDESFASPDNDQNRDGYAVHDFVELDNGQYIIAGFFITRGANFRRYVARLNSNGSLDLSFEFKEVLERGFSTWTSGFSNIGIQKDGKIVLGGSFERIVESDVRNGEFNYMNFVRLNNDGALDHTFGSSVSGDLSSLVKMILLPDDRLLASGFGYNSYPTSILDQNGKAETKLDFSSFNETMISDILYAGDNTYLFIGYFRGEYNPSTGEDSDGIVTVKIR